MSISNKGCKANCIPCFSNVYGVLFVDVLLAILNDNALVAVGNLLSCKIVQGRGCSVAVAFDVEDTCSSLICDGNLETVGFLQIVRGNGYIQG